MIVDNKYVKDKRNFSVQRRMTNVKSPVRNVDINYDYYSSSLLLNQDPFYSKKQNRVL